MGSETGQAPAYRLGELLRDLARELRDSGTGGWVRAVFCFFFSSRFHLMALYRLARFLVLARLGILSEPLRWLQSVLTGSFISPRASLGRHIRFPHPNGVVIGEGVVVEDDVWIFHQVTLGSHGREGTDRRYPLVKRGAKVYAGAKVIGAVTVGENAVIGANAVVLHDVPDGATAVGVPARICP